LPPETVTLSWTFPYLVEMASPVTVFEDDFADADDDEDEDEDEDDEVDFCVDGVATTVGVVATFAWALKPSVAARPATVETRTTGARFMRSLRVRRQRTRGADARRGRPPRSRQ
jgi:hypothetical protein